MKGRKARSPAYTTGDNPWAFEFAVGMPPQPTALGGGAFVFNFPRYDGVPEHSAPAVHYVTKPTGPLTGKSSLLIRGEVILGDGATLRPTEGDGPARLRLYFQHSGDNLSGQGVYRDYRFWSAPIDLVPGPFSFEAPLVSQCWSSVYPHDDDAAGFADCLANACKVGFTFGGEFAGHGVLVAGGDAHFKWTEYA